MAKKSNSTATKRKTTNKVEQKIKVEEQKPQSVCGEEGIDIVVPMVFPQERVWLQSYREACHKAGRSANIDERVRSWDLERYFLRGIAKFMPWVRKIHLILANEEQIPFWLDRSKIHVVLHEDIIPKELLPTFNSLSIEMWLHNIEGLSEKFIYCNDDMIVTAPMAEGDFFIDGKPVINCARKHFGTAGVFLRSCRNALDMACKDNGVTEDEDIMLHDGHSFAPMLFSVVKETADRHGKEMYDSCSPFREEKNLIQYLYTYELWLSGKCVNGHHVHRYFNINSDYDKMKKMILTGTAGVACFNDGGIGDWRDMKNALFNIMQAILGEKCKYEI